MPHRKKRAENLIFESRRDYDRIMAIVSSVLRQEAIPRWMETPIPALNSMTPGQMIGTGRMKELLAHCERYLDPSFS